MLHAFGKISVQTSRILPKLNKKILTKNVNVKTYLQGPVVSDFTLSLSSAVAQ